MFLYQVFQCVCKFVLNVPYSSILLTFTLVHDKRREGLIGFLHVHATAGRKLLLYQLS